MTKFNITGKQILKIELEIEADSIDEALQIANDREPDGFFDSMDIETTFYEYKDEQRAKTKRIRIPFTESDIQELQEAEDNTLVFDWCFDGINVDIIKEEFNDDNN